MRSSVKKLCDGCKVRPRFLFVGGYVLRLGDDNGSWPLSVDAVYVLRCDSGRLRYGGAFANCGSGAGCRVYEGKVTSISSARRIRNISSDRADAVSFVFWFLTRGGLF